jgi:hypothetical protein
MPSGSLAKGYVSDYASNSMQRTIAKTATGMPNSCPPHIAACYPWFLLSLYRLVLTQGTMRTRYLNSIDKYKCSYHNPGNLLPELGTSNL